LFGLDELLPPNVDARPGDGGAVDGDRGPPPPMDAPTGRCTTVALDVTFDELQASGNECTPWGAVRYANAGAMMQQQGDGVLRLTVSGNGLSNGGCVKTGQAWGPEGIIVEVPAVSNVSGVYTGLLTESPPDVALVVSDGMVRLREELGQIFAAAPYNPSSMRWWRMRPALTAIIAEVSSDGLAWNPLGTAPVMPPSTIAVHVTVGRSGGGVAGSSDFGRVILCQ
jgi:hypothetical protein